MLYNGFQYLTEPAMPGNQIGPSENQGTQSPSEAKAERGEASQVTASGRSEIADGMEEHTSKQIEKIEEEKQLRNMSLSDQVAQHGTAVLGVITKQFILND